jgi:hypothetical protein
MANQAPDPSWQQYQQRMDDDNMRTLAILHRVYGGLQLVISCCLLGYLAFIFGILGLATTSNANDKGAPIVVGGILAFVWVAIFVIVAVSALLHFLCANWLHDRRNWTGIIVVSAISCFQMPHGTALGVFTMIVLNRPHIRATFS